jgi:Rad3-related DNA helicase
MVNLPENIDDVFPMNEYRKYQRETIKLVLDAFRSGIKVCLIQAPTGSGKSAIGVAIAQCFNTAYWITSSRILQDQLVGDFGEKGKHIGSLPPIIDLKGRNAYPCNFWQRALADQSLWNSSPESQEKLQKFIALSTQRLGCDRGQCKRENKSKLPYCLCEGGCPYFIQMYKAQAAKVCLMNYHSFLFQSSVVPNFGKRDFMLLDEAHNSEDVLLQFIELRISDRHFATMKIRFPKLETVEEYVKYLEEIQLEDLIINKIKIAQLALDSKAEDEWKHLLLKYKILLEADPTQWVCIWEEVSSGASRTIILKPIFVDAFAQEHLFSKADHVLLMSATLLSKRVICEALGIDQPSKMFRLRCVFPKENRPLYFRPAGSMAFKKKAATLPALVEDVEFICRFHKDERGIIHTHTFEITRAILDTCGSDIRSRLLYQNDPEFNGNRQKMIEKHKRCSNSILIAPAMHEGLDLKDDLGRFQIICKVPYPSKGDPQVAARMALSQDYYDWKTACKLVQSTGRIVRHESDHGVTYVLDEDFRRFVKRNSNILPKWFTEAIIWD